MIGALLIRCARTASMNVRYRRVAAITVLPTLAITAAVAIGGGAVASASSDGRSSTPTMKFSPIGKSLAQIEHALRTGQTTSVALTKFYLARIDRFDKRGPAIDAITTVNPRALAQAAAQDQARKSHAQVGDLFGIPFVVRTITTSSACRRPAARWRWPTITRRRTQPSCSGS